MIAPLKLSRSVDNTITLPASWLRRGPTTPMDDGGVRHGLVPAGLQGLLHAQLLKLIGEAKEVILLASFLIADEKLAAALDQAHARGVRIYMLNASEQRLRSCPQEDDAFTARMVDDHKLLLDRLAGRVTLRSAEHFHAKFLVIDPQTPQAGGLLSTANFNRALHEGVELGVELGAEDSQALARLFNHAFWGEAEHELVELGRLAAVEARPKLPTIPEPRAMVATTRVDHGLRQEVLRLLAAAQKELLVSSYGLEEEHASVAALIAAAGRGVRVTVLTRPRPAVKQVCETLVAHGIRVVAHERLHAKAIWADGEGLVMTANLASQGLDAGFEAGIRLQGAQAAALEATVRSWCERFPWQFVARPSLQGEFSEICPADQSVRDGARQVVEEVVQTLPPIMAADALAMKGAKEPTLRSEFAGDKRGLPRRIRYDWEVRPPQLPQKARERKREHAVEKPGKDGTTITTKEKVSYVPPVFECDGRTYVLLRSDEERPHARKLAAELGATVVVR
ncbi:MAG: hypothetical protein FD161_1858 [Limisphaerales bacterium]|nr:MAG: hypothetical protein FD161_1858 [Limisphaerales bacterium]TXT49047.1 MAG: hypothetical protein FD140_3298 [Limisphaerales bacterium]